MNLCKGETYKSMTRKVMKDLRVVTSETRFIVGGLGHNQVYCDEGLNDGYKITETNSLTLREAIDKVTDIEKCIRWPGNGHDRFMSWYHANINNIDKESNG